MTKAVKQNKDVSKKKIKKAEDVRLTVPDLVILSLLAERPMHGYEVNMTLETRQIREWAPVSRPQIYYSLDKLLELRLIRITSDEEPSAGPERRVFETTAAGRERLADALELVQWIEDRVYQPFLIWLALSWQARGTTFRNQLDKRRKFLEDRLTTERLTLENVLEEVGHRHHEAVWMLDLKIGQTELELEWIEKIMSNIDKRAPARQRSRHEKRLNTTHDENPRNKKKNKR
jgi:DNA-binding PadR family transcriptional regulator